MEFVVRRATVADVDDLLRLRVLMWTSLGEAPPLPGEWSDHAEHDLRERLPEVDGDLAAFVVDGDGGRPVAAGFGLINQMLATPVRPDGRSGWVFDVVTEPDYRGRGIATALMTTLLAWFASHGVARVELRATDAGARVYERVGFTRYDEGMYAITITQLE